MSNDEEKNIRAIGAMKIVGGLITLPLTFIVVFIGVFVKMLGIFALVAGIVTKIASVINTENEKKVFWLERTKKLISFGTIGLISGIILTLPFLPGIILIFEGIYNAVAAEYKYGILPVLKASSNCTVDIMSKICSHCKTTDAKKETPKKTGETATPKKEAPKKKKVAAKAVQSKPTKVSKAPKKASEAAKPKKAPKKKA